MLPAIYAWLAKGCTWGSQGSWLSDAGFSGFVQDVSTTYVYIVLVQKAIARLTRLVAIDAALIG
jgi:hypothetical protein